MQSVSGCQEIFSEALGGRVLFFPDLSSGEIPLQAGLHRSLLAGEKAERAKRSPPTNQRKNQPGSLRRKKKFPGKSRLLGTH